MQSLRRILIAGGGSSGWMTAALLSRLFQGLYDVVLVESEDIGTIGVGEATIPAIKKYNELLGLDENEFMIRTQASFKLGIQFNGWLNGTDSYIHGFGVIGQDLEWLDGEKLLSFKGAAPEVRNRLATAMFKAWWHPFSHYGVIHGDPHLGNYTVFRDEAGEPAGINLLDYGCIRIFPPKFVAGVVDLYRGLMENDEARTIHAYEVWGFRNLSRDLIDVLNIWARFIYGPLLDDRVRTIADGISPGQYGRAEAARVHKALKERGPVTIPREFVFMDRAAIGLGGVFLHLEAELNFFALFNAEIADFTEAAIAERQKDALKLAGLT